jgi:hypothetical protein
VDEIPERLQVPCLCPTNQRGQRRHAECSVLKTQV